MSAGVAAGFHLQWLRWYFAVAADISRRKWIEPPVPPNEWLATDPDRRGTAVLPTGRVGLKPPLRIFPSQLQRRTTS
jgi:hypothetical protein